MYKVATSTNVLHAALAKILVKSRKFDANRDKLSRQERVFIEGLIKRQGTRGPGSPKSHTELMRLMAKSERVPGKPPKLNTPLDDDLVPRVDTASVIKGNKTRGYPYSTKFFRVKKYTDRD